ncbi:hypothetical protein C8F01DRAFT_1098606 [Mycena amicta]|nr:hypothetical protein C8F01DRAFT_1098606 [Mycena amicta]
MDAAARAADRARLSEVQAKIQNFETHLAALRIEEEDIRRRLDKSTYPVLTLPNEIVAEIFVHYLPAYPDHPPLVGPGSPTYLLGICRLWRSIALHSPALWRAIQVGDTGCEGVDEQDLEVAKHWLQRSGASPVSLHFHFGHDSRWGAELRSSLVQIAVAHHSRWQYISFRFLPHDLLPSICVSAPRLVQFKIHTTHNLSSD